MDTTHPEPETWEEPWSPQPALPLPQKILLASSKGTGLGPAARRALCPGRLPVVSQCQAPQHHLVFPGCACTAAQGPSANPAG